MKNFILPCVAFDDVFGFAGRTGIECGIFQM